MARVVEWDGKNVPAGLRPLPAGRYVIEAVDEVIALTPEEEAGLEEAIDSIEAGDPGLTAKALRRDLHAARRQ